MTSKKALPILFAAALAVAAGAVVATAQSTTTDTPTAAALATEEVVKADFRSGDNDGHGGHGGRDGMMMQILLQADSDGNGSVTQAEIDAFRTAQVTGADTNSDGALTIEEFDTVYRVLTRSGMVDAFQALDEDGDGTVTADRMTVVLMWPIRIRGSQWVTTPRWTR